MHQLPPAYSVLRVIEPATQAFAQPGMNPTTFWWARNTPVELGGLCGAGDDGWLEGEMFYGPLWILVQDSESRLEMKVQKDTLCPKLTLIFPNLSPSMAPDLSSSSLYSLPASIHVLSTYLLISESLCILWIYPGAPSPALP